jgi:hypothetical protein
LLVGRLPHADVLQYIAPMSKVTTSVRIDQALRQALAGQAAGEGITLTELIQRYLVEGMAASRYHGIVFRGGPTGRRAALAGGPDVWEVVVALREVPGSEDDRVRLVAAQLGMHEREVALALDYAAAHRAEIDARIAANEVALVEAERVAGERSRLLA